MLNAVFKALKDPTRRAILEQLKEEDRSAGEIASAFDMAKPSVSNHLDILCQAGLTVRYRKGQFIFYTLNATVLEEILSWIYQFSDQSDSRNHDESTSRPSTNTPGSEVSS
jgi:DNA-binding transcriptional ArsR family regulator